MATYKIMLVEDDHNLRAIYGDRLTAEGYDIVSARDGEEGLAMAVKEKPQLIISDVMMPKISGFDMVDILRATPETKDVKIIMMTALSQAEDKARAEKLGADKYLVKSQVTLEDVARVVHEVLGDNIQEAAQMDAEHQAYAGQQPAEQQTYLQPLQSTSVATPETVPTNPFAAPSAPILNVPVPAAQPTFDPAQPVQQPAAVQSPTQAQVPSLPPEPTSAPIAPTPMPAPSFGQPMQPAPMPAFGTPATSPVAFSAPQAAAAQTDAVNGTKRIIQPLNTVDPNAQPKIYDLYEKEMAEQSSMMPVINPITGTVLDPSAAPANPAVQAPATPIQTSAPQVTASQTFDPNAVAL